MFSCEVYCLLIKKFLLSVKEKYSLETMNPSEKSINPLRTLRLEILSENSSTFVVASPNSREPIPFETEFFKGHAMLVVRTNPVDPPFQSFFNGK